MRHWIGIVALLLVGCGAALRPDPVAIPSYDANYAAGEGMACGSLFNGLAICEVQKGALLNSIKLSFKGYGQGTIRLDSETCQVSTAFRYTGTGDVPVTLPGTVTDSCLIDFVINHELPKEDSSGLQISPIKGRIWITVNQIAAVSQVSKIKDSLDGRMTLTNLPGPDAKISMRACGVNYDATVPVVNGSVLLKLSDMGAPRTFNTRCALTGLVTSGREMKMIRWMYFVYDQKYTPLPIPALARDKTNISVNADTAVSIISLDDVQVVRNTASFKFDATKNHVLRMLTVSGRILLGVWSAKNGEWSWIM